MTDPADANCSSGETQKSPTAGQTATLGQFVVGYEVDEDLD